MTNLNEAGRAYARSLIAAGQVDKTAGWDFSAEDGDALLGGDNNWPSYGRAHLGVDETASENTKAYWKYPVVKGGKVYRAAVIAAKQRAAAEGDSAIEAAASALLEQIDGDTEGKASRTGELEVKITPFEFKFAEENGTAPGQFEGYGSVFNNLDDYGDVVAPTAFDRTLARSKASGRMPKMLLNHGGLADGMMPTPHDLLPIGKWNDLAPDTTGLEGKGRLINLDTESGKRIYGAMKEGELDELSIGYIARAWDRPKSRTDPRRRLTAVDLNEISPVTFGANSRALITSVKSLRFAANFDMRELETALRDGGLSRSDAVKAVAVFKTRLQRDAGDEEPELRDAATAADVRALTERIRAG